MGTVSQLHERARPPAHRIESDEEALDIARTLAAGYAQRSSDHDINRVLPHEELDTLSQSGLLGITVPSEYDGLDISNSILAEILAILAQGDPSIAQVPQNHFHILEALRTDASEEQKKFFFTRALAGDRFGNALSDTQDTRLTSDGPGYRLIGRKTYSTGVLFADWISVVATDAAERLILSLVSRDAEGIQIIDDWDGFGQRTTGSGTTILHNVYVNADAVVPYHKSFERPTTTSLVGGILHSGIDLGIARAAFAETLDFVRNHAPTRTESGAGRAADDPLTIVRIGQIAIRIEAAAAMMERAGGQIDIAQISPTEAHVVEATLSVAAARTLSAEIALEASSALFELAGMSATRIGLNLDRHWRNARTHTLNDSARWKHHLVGNYHLNDISPWKKPGE